MTEQEKRENVIRGLECCLDIQSGWKDATYVCQTCPYTDNGIPCETLAPLMEDALALLKAQEPKPPIIKENSYGWKFYYCASCGKEFYQNNKFSFCEKCGQAVKWNG